MPATEEPWISKMWGDDKEMDMAAEIVLSSKHGGDCILCMCRPTSEGRTKRVLPMFTAVGVDVNWGENANICQVCAGVMADLLGRPPAEKVRELRDKVVNLMTEKRELADKLAEQQKDLDKIKEGARAQRRVRAA